MPFLDTFKPITNRFAFVECSPQEASESIFSTFEKYLSVLFLNFHFKKNRNYADPLYPLKKIKNINGRCLSLYIMETHSKWSVILSNSLDPFYINYATSSISKRRRCQGIVVNMKRGEKELYPTYVNSPLDWYSFAYYDGSPEIVRAVANYDNGDKWKFEAEGVIRDFENADYYQNRNRKEKLNSSILMEYLINLKIETNDESLNGNTVIMHQLNLLPFRTNRLKAISFEKLKKLLEKR